MNYQEFLAELKSFSDEDYRTFHKRLLKNDNIQVLGVKVPILRKIAKKYKAEVDELMTFPDEYYEVTFVKLTAVSLLPYNELLKYIETCVSLMDNWATCDCFVPKCIESHKDDFLKLPPIYAAINAEFYQRFALTSLLHFYVEDKYLEDIFSVLKQVNTKCYYVHMAAAWLIAEVLVKCYDDGIEFLQSGVMDKRTHNKAIQKACESYRLSDEQKNFLKGMKR